ncbi:MAG: hypothetical protein AB8B88_02480 [Devosiaceae bacterium]
MAERQNDKPEMLGAWPYSVISGFAYTAEQRADNDALSLESADIACPLTRSLRVLGNDELKAKLTTELPSVDHLALHVKQVSELLQVTDCTGNLAVDIDVMRLDERTLSIEAAFSSGSDRPFARSISTIAFVTRDQLPVSQAVKKPKRLVEKPLIISFDKVAVRHYCKISGDDNPIHSDDTILTALGLASLTVPGAMVLQRIEALINTHRDWTLNSRIECQFVDMVAIDEACSLSIRPSPRGIGLPLRFVLTKSNGRIAIFGSITAE